MRRLFIVALASLISARAMAEPPPAPAPAPEAPLLSTPGPSTPETTRGEPVTQELNPYEPWYRGTYGNNRMIHMGVTAGLGLMFAASETFLKKTLFASSCRWCEPPGFDRSVRNALVWNNTDRADLLSTLDAYVLAPVVGAGFLLISDHAASASRVIDDILPVAETVAVSQLFTNIVKITAGRSRPYAHFGDPNAPRGADDNASFISGHSVLGFSITASAGLVCHWRHYWTEPYVWGAGIAISLSTEYLRMSADKHYLSDVVAGGLVGLGFGLTVPRLMRRDIKIVPAPNGAAIIGQF